jgi:hypothetical protein
MAPVASTPSIGPGATSFLSGLKASPRTQPLRWEKAFNPQNTRCILAVAATLSSKSGLTIKILLNATAKALYYLKAVG